jgi:small subunit ribosomal protein S4
MSKRSSAKYKLDRRMGENIWGRPKSPVNKREYGPGQHGQRRKGKMSDFGIQLRAKQKLKGYYGDVTEKQFRKVYAEAVRMKGDTSQNLIGLLEQRLDMVVYRAKFAPTVFAARQIVNHGHILVNGRAATSPRPREAGRRDRAGQPRPSEMALVLEAQSFRRARRAGICVRRWPKATYVRVPTLDEVPYPVKMEPNLVVEFYRLDGQRDGLRRLRHQRAGTGLERLCRDRHEGQDRVILVNDPDYETEGLEGPFNGRAMTYYGRWTYKFEEAARQGAAAALIVHDTFPASYGWNVVESSWTGPQPIQRGRRRHDQTLVNGWVQKDVPRKILKARPARTGRAVQGGQAEGLQARAARLKALDPVSTTRSAFESKNVIGILPGRERGPTNTCSTPRTGTTSAAAPRRRGRRHLQRRDRQCHRGGGAGRASPKRTQGGPADRSQVFLAVTPRNRACSAPSTMPPTRSIRWSRTVGGVNMDALLAAAGPARDVTVIGGGKSELDAYLAKRSPRWAARRRPIRSPQAGYYYRSDHFSLAKRGVPMFYVKGGQDLVKAAARQARRGRRPIATTGLPLAKRRI